VDIDAQAACNSGGVPVATPGEWQCKTGGVRRLAVANGPNIFQMLLLVSNKSIVDGRLGSWCRIAMRVQSKTIDAAASMTIIWHISLFP